MMLSYLKITCHLFYREAGERPELKRLNTRLQDRNINLGQAIVVSEF